VSNYYPNREAVNTTPVLILAAADDDNDDDGQFKPTG
jgi:hypothetical protein